MAIKTRTFSRDTMQAIGEEEIEGFEIVEDNIVDTTRWSEIHTMIFEHEGKTYRSTYSCGATEMQDEAPYEYDDEEIVCEEVELKQVMIETYVPVQEEEE